MLPELTSGWPGPGWLSPTLRRALSAVRNSQTERWSGGQALSTSVGLAWVSMGHCSLIPPPTPSLSLHWNPSLWVKPAKDAG